MHDTVKKETLRIKQGHDAPERTDIEEEDLDLIFKHYPTEFASLNKNIMHEIVRDYIM